MERQLFGVLRGLWPFGLLLLSPGTGRYTRRLNPAARHGLAAMLQWVTQGDDRVFHTPFPYAMGLHPAPCGGLDYPEWRLHLHFSLPLLRSATVRKFMVSFALLGSPQRDITPEGAALILRKAIGETA